MTLTNYFIFLIAIMLIPVVFYMFLLMFMIAVNTFNFVTDILERIGGSR